MNPDTAAAPREAALRPDRPARGTVRQRLVAALVVGLGSLAAHTPERLLWPLADVLGELSYRMSPRDRRDRARRNLERVVTWLAEHDLGPAYARRAAREPRALETLVRRLYRHHVRSYMELVGVARIDARYVRERLFVENPDVVDRALVRGRRIVLVGLHFGGVELPAFFAASRIGTITAPVETVGNPGIQAFLTRSRESAGLHLVTLDRAALEMRAALRRDEPAAAIGDRDLTGTGVTVELFGAPATLPAGPVLLAIELHADAYTSGVRRVGPGRYRGSLRPIPTPQGGPLRERIRGMVQAQAHLFEQIIADAPEQWLAAFHPIWPDLEAAAAAGDGAGVSTNDGEA